MRIINYLNYICSQITYKWISPTFKESNSFFSNINMHKLSIVDWENIILEFFFSEQLSRHCAAYIEVYDPQATKLAKVAFEHLQTAKALGAHICIISDSDYPYNLKHIKDPPLALNYLGPKINYNQLDLISIVGSRQASTKALKVSFEFAKKSALNNKHIISGGAFGCDIKAHLGVLSAQETPCPTTVVFAGGLNELYPVKLNSYYQLLKSSGAILMSERLFKQKPRKFDFPTRNRIIAGISPTTYLMQAHQKSGALITANYALREGREVIVLRHGSDIRAVGGEKLIFDGAECFNESF